MKLISFVKSSLRRTVPFLLMLLTLIPVFCIPASASGIEETPYDTYTYWAGPGSSTTAVSSSAMYEFDRVIDAGSLGISAFNEPSDIFTDKDGLIYLVDGGNGRIVVINTDYTLNKIITNLSYNGEELNFTGAQGIFVTNDKRIYIADTENARVIVTNLNSTVTSVLTLPDEDVIPDTFSYRPSKVSIDSKGYTYIVSDGSYYGALLYRPNGTFSGFYGSNSVTSSVLDVFSRIYDMIFVSDVKKENQEKTLPYSFTDLAIDDEDFVYTATGAVSTWVSNEGQLKKLSPGGTNVLKDKTGRKVTSAESKNFSDGRGTKYISASGWYEWRVADLRSMDVDKSGYMYTVCGTYGHIFIYDQECNLLTAFGGGSGKGKQDGTFYKASAIHLNDINQNILLVDKMNSNFTVFKETEYGALVKKAQQITNDGSYIDAKPYWEKVLTFDRNSQLAYKGLAKATLMAEDYKACMEYSKLAYDQDTYATAFKFVRNEYVSNNFVWIFGLAVILVGGLIALLVYTNKHKLKLIKNDKVSTMLQCLTHPFEATKQIRYYNKGSTLIASIILILFYVSTVLNDMYSGFIYNLFDKSSYNAGLVILTTIVAYLLWVLVNWAVSTLVSGKGKISHIFIVTCYSLVPLIIGNILNMILTNVVHPDEELIISVVSFICQAIFYIIMCVGIMTVHEFGFFKFLVLTAVTFIGMFICVFIAFMIFVLIQQLLSFIDTIFKEVSYR